MHFLSLKKKIGLGILFGILSVTVVFGPTSINVQSVTPVYATASADKAAADAERLAAQQAAAASSENGCHTWSFGCKIVTAVGRVILRVTAFIMWLGAIVFNFIIEFTVINFKGNLDAISGVNIGWTVFRDLANIFFIFILLYIAIGTILRLEGINTKKMLSTLIVVALLLNFSLFFTKVIVDASNIMSLVFFSKIRDSGGRTLVQGNGSGSDTQHTLAAVFAAPLGVGQLVSPGDINRDRNGGEGNPYGVTQVDTNYPSLFMIELMIGIILLVMAFVFFAASIMFVYRFVVLIYLMLLSPLAFAGMILPKTKSMIADKWWKTLIDQCLFAPVFFMLLWVVIAIIQSQPFLHAQGGAGFADLFSGAKGAVAGAHIIMNFIIVIGLLVGTLIVSKSLGASGAAGAISVGKGMVGSVQKRVRNVAQGGLSLANDARKGAQGMAARGAIRTLGIAGAAGYMENKLKDTKFGESSIGRGLRRVTSKAVLESKFGSGRSVADVQKARAERDVRVAKHEEEVVLPKKFQAQLHEQRVAKHTEIQGNVAAAAAASQAAQAAVATKQAELARIQAAQRAAISKPAQLALAQQARVKQAELTAANKEVTTKTTEEAAHQTLLAENQQRMSVYTQSGGKEQENATKEEKEAGYRRIRQERLDRITGTTATIDPSTGKPYAPGTLPLGTASRTVVGPDRSKMKGKMGFTRRWAGQRTSVDAELAKLLRNELKKKDGSPEEELKRLIRELAPPAPTP